MNDTLYQALTVIPALIIAIVFHEVAHGYTALLLGDPTAKERNRLSLNPIRHVDLMGTIIVPGMLTLVGAPAFGWAKPVPVLQHRLNNPRYGMMIVAAAGPASNFVMAAIAAVFLGLIIPGPTEVQAGPVLSFVLQSLLSFIQINVFLALFNLIPLPPFDGSHIVEALLPDQAALAYSKLRPYGLPLLFGLLIVIPWIFPSLGLVEALILPPFEWLAGKYFGISMWIAGA